MANTLIGPIPGKHQSKTLLRDKECDNCEKILANSMSRKSADYSRQVIRGKSNEILRTSVCIHTYYVCIFNFYLWFSNFFVLLLFCTIPLMCVYISVYFLSQIKYEIMKTLILAAALVN